MAPQKIPPTLASFQSLPNDALVDVKFVAMLFACSENTVWRRAKLGMLPKPVRVSSQQTRWRVGGIRKALASLDDGQESA